uniref:Uncharacterized protein n=1 Tax=Trichuris muris TaxID=70415 RepID=A0A5S6Q9Q6_TRIMR
MNGRGGRWTDGQRGDAAALVTVTVCARVVYFSLLAARSSGYFVSECSTCAYPSILKGITENPRGYSSKAKEAVAHHSERQVFEDFTALALIRGQAKLKRVRHVRA